jgi:putative peptidoglycan lipid II flippase
MASESQSVSPNHGLQTIARAALTVMAAFLLSSLVGLVRQILVAGAFGAGSELDAFNSANRVSETLFNLVAGGALASAFLPTFTTLLTREDRKGAWQLASALANLIVIVVASLGLIVVIFAPQVVSTILAPGFANDPALLDLTVSLLRWMLPSALLFAVSGLVMSILNAHQVFFIPALTPAIYQFGLIIGVTVLKPYGVYGLAWGVLIGAAGHLAVQIPSLLKLKGTYSAILGLNLDTVREVIRLMLPRLLGVAVVQLNFWVNTNLASRMEPGSVAALTFGFALMLMAQAAIAQSVATAALPTFSAQVARGELVEMRHTLAGTIRWLLLLSIPGCVGLMALAAPLVAMLYQRGSFDAHDTAMVAWALLWYALGLVGHSLVEILARAFYSLHDTKTPVLIGVCAMLLNIFFSLAFTNVFRQIGWLPYGGLAFANSLATALEMIVLLFLMKRRMHGLEGRAILAGLLPALLASGVMALFLWGWLAWSEGSPAYVRVLVGVTVGAGVYASLLWILRVREARSLVGFGASYLKRLKTVISRSNN